MVICLSCIQCVIQEDITNKCVLQKHSLICIYICIMYVLWLLGNWFGTANIMVYIVQSFSKHGSLFQHSGVSARLKNGLYIHIVRFIEDISVCLLALLCRAVLQCCSKKFEGVSLEILGINE